MSALQKARPALPNLPKPSLSLPFTHSPLYLFSGVCHLTYFHCWEWKLHEQGGTQRRRSVCVWWVNEWEQDRVRKHGWVWGQIGMFVIRRVTPRTGNTVTPYRHGHHISFERELCWVLQAVLYFLRLSFQYQQDGLQHIRGDTWLGTSRFPHQDQRAVNTPPTPPIRTRSFSCPAQSCDMRQENGLGSTSSCSKEDTAEKSKTN